MNLQEFIDERTHCPICNTALITQFISSRKQKIKLENDRLVVVFVMKSMSVNQPDYEVGYAFNTKDNTFHIEFYSEWDHYKHVPMHMIDKFKEFHKNLGPGRFYRKCVFCSRYAKSTVPFTLDFKTQKIDTGLWETMICGTESFGLAIPAEKGFKIMMLNNYYFGEERSQLIWFRADSENAAHVDWTAPVGSSAKKLPLIPFVSKEETTKRINNLLTFA